MRSENSSGPMILCWDGSDGAERAIGHAARLVGEGCPGICCRVFILIDSIFGLVVALSQKRSGVDAVWGVLGLVFGVLLIRHPFGSVTAIAIFVGIWLVAAGALRLLGTFAARESWWQLGLAVLEIVAGIVIVSSPHVGFSALALLVGISFVLHGLGLILIGW